MPPSIAGSGRAGPRNRPRRLLTRLRGFRGQSIAEFAIILPVLLLMVMTALDFGRLFLGWVVLNNAARVGANYAALHADAWESPGNPARRTTFESLVRDTRDDAGIALGGCAAEPVPNPAFPSGTDIGDHAVVVLDCSFSPMTPVIADVFSSVGTPLSVSARSVFPIRTGAIHGPPMTPIPSCLARFDWAVDPVDPLTVHFTDTTSGTSSGWIWDFGDASGSALQDPTRTYAAGGSFTVTLSDSVGGIGCTPYVDTISVTAPPPTPGPGSSPGASASPSASASPAPTAEPGCSVPSFIGKKKNDSAGMWSGVGFTTTITYSPNPNGNWTIEFQSLVGGQAAPCNTPITLGPDPMPTLAP